MKLKTMAQVKLKMVAQGKLKMVAQGFSPVIRCDPEVL